MKGANDTVTIALGTSNIALISGTVGGSAATNVTHTADVVPGGTFSYRKAIAIGGQIGASCGADLTNFPVLISLSGVSEIKTTSNGGHVQNTNGYEIIFKDANGNQLDHEVESYNGTTGTLVAWVRIPTLDYNGDTLIYMYYANSSISTSQENKTGVWSNNFREVFHFKETSGTLYDSTSNGYTGTKAGNATLGVSGKIANAVDFDGSAGSRVTLADGTMASDQTFTLSAWVRADTLASQWEGIVTKGRDSDIDWQGLWINGSNLACFGWELPAGNVDGSALSTGRWYYISATYDGTNRRLCLNNALNGGPSAGSHASGVTESTLVGEVKQP